MRALGHGEGRDLRQRGRIDPQGNAPDDRAIPLRDQEVADLPSKLLDRPGPDELQTDEHRQEARDRGDVLGGGRPHDDLLVRRRGHGFGRRSLVGQGSGSGGAARKDPPRGVKKGRPPEALGGRRQSPLRALSGEVAFEWDE